MAVTRVGTTSITTRFGLSSRRTNADGSSGASRGASHSTVLRTTSRSRWTAALPRRAIIRRPGRSVPVLETATETSGRTSMPRT